jgi:hypothetical protein
MAAWLQSTLLLDKSEREEDVIDSRKLGVMRGAFLEALLSFMIMTHRWR